MEGHTNPFWAGGLVQRMVLIRKHHLFTVFHKRFEEQPNSSCLIMLEMIFSGADIIKSDVWTEKTETFDWLCCIENLMFILRRKTCCYIMKCPIEKSLNIPKPNGCFDLSFVGTTYHSLFCFEWWMLSLIDWFVYVRIIWIIFSSMNVGDAKSGSMITWNSGLTPGLFGMFCGAWQMFCLGFVVVQVWWNSTLFFKRNINFFCFSLIKINHVIVYFIRRCCDTWNYIFFVSTMKLFVCNRLISFRTTIITLFIIRCQGFISVL